MAFHHTSNQTAASLMEMLSAEHPTLLSREELRRELADPVGVDDALSHFERYGLVHRLESPDGLEVFWPTRSAMAAAEAASAGLSSESGPTRTRVARLSDA